MIDKQKECIEKINVTFANSSIDNCLDKLCHLLFIQPYPETALCIDLFPLRLTSSTYLPYLPTQLTVSETE